MSVRPVRCPGPSASMSRRGFLQLGSVALGAGVSGAVGGLRSVAAAGTKGRPVSDPDTAVIFIWLPGGPPHLETFDPKPDAPAEIRGAFGSIPTKVPGLRVCEHLPQLAACADKYAVIRSFHHDFADHGGGHKRFLTGRDPLQPTGFVNDFPMVGSMAAKMREGRPNAGVPDYVAGVDGGRQGIDTFSFGAAYLGQSTHPFMVPGDPSEPKFQVRDLGSDDAARARIRDRLDLLKAVDRLDAATDRTGGMSAMGDFHGRAAELLTTDRARTAFDLGREADKLRDRYGRHRYGQRCLLARRLVEAGSSFVSMVLENPGGKAPDHSTYNWDSHAVNCDIFIDTKYKLGFLDQAVSALIDDLYARGLDKRVMLIVTGEFGRTPRLEKHAATGRPGRDHWPAAMSVLVSGGGLKVGQVVGSTNAKGEHPLDRPMSPNDLWATMFRHLGIDWNHNFIDHQGRPMPILPHGEAIAELI